MDACAKTQTQDLQPQKLSRTLIGCILAICLLPVILNKLGVDFGTAAPRFDPSGFAGDAHALTDALHHSLAGSFTHTILEWSAFCAAIFTALFSFVHYRISRNPAMPIIGVTLFCSGCMDAFHTLAADRLIEVAADNHNLIPFTWTICRLFNALILIAGIGILLKKDFQPGKGNSGFVLAISLMFGAVAYSIIHASAISSRLPETLFPDAFIARPWDMLPLFLFLFSGIVLFPLYYKKTRSVLAHALIISAIPQVGAQVYMAFGSTDLFDNAFNIAHFLKILAYLVPLLGFAYEYAQTCEEKENRLIKLNKAQEEIISGEKRS